MPSLRAHARCTNVRVPITSAPSFRPLWSPRGHPQKRSQTPQSLRATVSPGLWLALCQEYALSSPAPSLRQSPISADPLPSSELPPVAGAPKHSTSKQAGTSGGNTDTSAGPTAPAREPDPSSFPWVTCGFPAGLAPGGQDTTPCVGGGFGGKAEAGILYLIPSVDPCRGGSMATSLSAAVSGLEVLASLPPLLRPAVPSGSSLGAGWLPCGRGLLRFQGTSGKLDAGQDPSSVRAPPAVPLLDPSNNARGQHRRQGPRSSFPLYPGDHTFSCTSAISFSSVQSLCPVRLFATPWTEAPRLPCP